MRKLAVAITSVLVLFGATRAARAEGPVVNKATCELSWNAPTTNADGTPLTDLAGYHVYLGTSAADVIASGPTLQVAAPSPTPVAGSRVVWSCAAIAVQQHYTQIAAFDTSGNISVRTPVFPFVVQSVVTVNPAPSAPTNVQVR